MILKLTVPCASPETMGAVCAVVYLLALIFFIPFAFYKDIVAATSGGGNRDVVLEVHHVETGRMLHRFPHGRVCDPPTAFGFNQYIDKACSLHLTSLDSFPCNVLSSWDWVMTFLTFDGDTKFSYQLLEQFQCL